MSGHQGFDAPREVGSVVDAIPDEIDFVCRYYSFNPGKDLSAGEAKTLCEADLKLVAVWETDGKPISRPQAKTHAAAAMKLASLIGQPKGSAIYFTVDYDATRQDISQKIIPYFQGLREAIGDQYAIGVYGSGLVCQTLRDKGFAKYLWLSGSSGWAGTRSFTGWHIRQHSPNTDPWYFGFNIDLDETQGDDYGQFVV